MQKKVYVDGANVVYNGVGEICASRIKSAVEGLEKYGFEAHIVFPSYMFSGNNNKKNVKESEIIEKFIKQGKLDLIQNEDDIVLISLAYEMKSFILSNDKFSDHKQKEWCTPEMEKWIDKCRISYEIVEGKLVIPANIQYKIRGLIQTEKMIPSKNQGSSKKESAESINLTDIPIKDTDTSKQKIIEIVERSPGKVSFATLGSEIKNETGSTIKKRFGSAKKFAEFLGKVGYKVIQENGQYYISGAVA